MKRFVLIQIMLVLTLAGCKTAYLPVVSTDTVTIVNEVVRDSIVSIPADSSFIRAWFECDSLNQVIMTELETKSGKKVQQQTTFENGQLLVAATVDSLAIYLSWKERHDTAKVTQVIYQPVPYEVPVKTVPRWVRILAMVGALGIAGSIVKIFLKFK